MVNLSVKWSAFLIADGILFMLLGASRYIWQSRVPLNTPMSLSAVVRATYNYYYYGALFIAVGVTLLLVPQTRNRTLNPKSRVKVAVLAILMIVLGSFLFVPVYSETAHYDLSFNHVNMLVSPLAKVTNFDVGALFKTQILTAWCRFLRHLCPVTDS